MAKNKKQKKGLSDAVNKKKSSQNKFSAGPKKQNPFEVHVNREKFEILGRKSNHSRGLPGASRAKAFNRRKDTLGQEFLLKDKANKFIDRRITGNDESAAMARFTSEKMLQFTSQRKDRFNLNDDEILTHKGQTLADIEQFHNEASDDDLENDEELNENFTEAAHFGGGGEDMDRKSAIDEMIAEAKRKKAEAAKDKEEVHQLTDNLDAQYKLMASLMGKLTKNDDEVRPKADDYDRAMREMIFEPKGSVADKLESAEEIAEKERARLQKLEQERLARMRGEDPNAKKQQTHRSADALDDDFYFGGDDEEEEPNILAYGLDGQREAPKAVEEEEEEGSDLGDDLNGEDEEAEDGEEEEEGDDESEEDGTDDEDNLSDLKDSDSEKEESGDENESTENKVNLNLNKMTEEEESSDLPFTYEMPGKYEDFVKLVQNQSPSRQGIIIERVIKCNHPKLDGNNREKMLKLFTYLLQYINDLFSEPSEDELTTAFKVLDKLMPHLFDLIQIGSEKMSLCLIEVIKEKHRDFKKNPKNFPELDTLVFFKIVSNLCSTSDFRHNVVSPCFIFISHILSKVQPKTRSDIACGLFLVTLVLEYTMESKRFLPSALNYLLGIVHMSIPKRPIEVLKIIPPFSSTGVMSKLLAIGDLPKNEKFPEELLTSADLVSTFITTDFKIRALNTSLRLIGDFLENLKENVGTNFLADPFLEMFERLNLDVYPEYVQKSATRAKDILKAVSEKPLKKLVPPPSKPKMIQFLEPMIEKVSDDKRRPKLTKAKEERAKLVHKIRRETKGAIREIRRDTQFVQSIRHKSQMAG
ncbi:NOP14 family protein [Megaselia abdita]